MAHKTVADVMTRDVVSVPEGLPFHEVVRVLAGHNVSGAPVLDQKRRVVGMVSEADLLDRQARHGGMPGIRAWISLRRRPSDRKGAARTAAELMNHPLVAVSPDTRVAAAAAVLARHGVKRAVVVNPGGVLVGIVSRKDLLTVYLRSDAELADEIRAEVLEKAMWLTPSEVSADVRDGVVTLRGTVEGPGMIDVISALTEAVDGVVEVHNEIVADTARDIMHLGVRTISETDSIAAAACRMRDLDVGALPVHDRYGAPVGIVTDRDLLVKCVAAGKDPYRTSVGSVATDKLVAVRADSNVTDVLDLMRQHRIRRLPVVENNRLIGIITEADLAHRLPARTVGRFLAKLYTPPGPSSSS